MASISLAGPSSGIDVNSIVTQQLNVEKQPVAEPLPQPVPDPEPVQTHLSSVGKLQSSLSTFLSASQTLGADSTWSSVPSTATSSQPASVGATSDGTAAAGNYSVDVNSVAAAQATTSASFSGMGTVIGLGTLHIELGGWNSSQTAFSMNPNWPKSDVMVGPHDNSLEKIRDKINAAGVGVVASVISDATGSRLVLRSTSTGQDNGFKVSATEDPASKADVGLAALGFDPSLNQNGTTLTQAAADATGQVNGVDVKSPSNTVTDAVPGLSLKFSKVTDGAVDVSVSPDKNSIRKSITDFAQSYNELNAAGQAPASLNRQQFADIGLESETDGSLRIDSAKLGTALAERLDQVKDTFVAANRQAASAGASESSQRRNGADPPALAYTAKLLEQYRALESSASTPTASAMAQ